MKEDSSDLAMGALNNSSNSISINAPQNINAFKQITTLENRISLLEPENRLWRSSSILMKATFRVATIKSLRLVLFRKIITLQ